MTPPGRVPKPPSQRRRATKPGNYGLAEPLITGQIGTKPRTLGIKNPHPMVRDMWTSLSHSVEHRFYSDSDWQRVRSVLWYMNELMTAGRVPGAQAWTAVQNGLNDLLISPSEKRRVGIELSPEAPDAPKAVVGLDDYRKL